MNYMDRGKLSAVAAFDKAAQRYDEEFEDLPATRRLRRKVWNIYYQYFHPGDTLLELNCGTGTDAIELASKGIRIVATDASIEMIAMMQRKIQGTALHSLISPRQLSFHRLRELSGRQFDGAYSNLGGLNCTSKLERVAVDLAALVKPGKYIVLCLLSDFSFWETISFIIRGKWKQALRRKAPLGVLAEMKGERVWVHYYSPQYVQRTFAPFFELIEIKGLNIFSPPPTSRIAHRLLGRGVGLLESFDASLPKNSRLNAWGDHVVYVLRRADG